MLIQTNINKGSLLNLVDNSVITTTGTFKRLSGYNCIGLISGQNITISKTFTGYSFSMFIKYTADTILIKDGSTTVVSISSGAIVATGSNKILIDTSTTNALKKDTWHHVYVEYNAGQLVKIEIQRTVTGVQTLLVNDVVIGSTEADLTWLTSENMRIPSQYTSTFEIGQIIN